MIHTSFIYQTVSQCFATIQIEQNSPFDFYWYKEWQIGSYLHFIRLVQTDIKM